MFSKNNKQAGFSLVELMVVVAIIGILASVAIPSVNKYMAKARQSEAKTNLASLYTAEKAFFAEYNTFDPRFGAVGFTPEGALRYDVGFTSGINATAGDGYYATPATEVVARAYCGVAGVMKNGCTILATATADLASVADEDCGATGTNNGSTHATASCTTAKNTFRAGASTILTRTGGKDQWSIDDLKVLRNTRSGID